MKPPGVHARDSQPEPRDDESRENPNSSDFRQHDFDNTAGGSSELRSGRVFPPYPIDVDSGVLDQVSTNPSARTSEFKNLDQTVEPRPDAKDQWRQLRSRKVMRKLQMMAKLSSRSLRLGKIDLSRTGTGEGHDKDTDTERDRGDATDGLRHRAPPVSADQRKEKSGGSIDDDPLPNSTSAEDLDELEDKLSAWLQCSGLHTVDKWVLNYRKHPSCWAALLMMHGVPEVSGRLRAKVENYAIYSALFLSCTIQAVMSPPDVMQCDEREFSSERDEMKCQVMKRIATYALLGAVAMHFYSIILAMAFVNALNETAREADVFRMFARGQGYLATYKCQQAFRNGAGFCMIAIGAVSLEYIGWDAVVWIVCLLSYILYNFKHTSELLFSTGSLVHYWRTELGGKPDPDDPYEIAPAVHVFKERVKFSRGVLGDEDFFDEDALGGKAEKGKIWKGKGEDRREVGGGHRKVWKTGSFVNASGWSWSSTGSSNKGDKGKSEVHDLSSVDEIVENGNLETETTETKPASPELLLKSHHAKNERKKQEKKVYNDQHLGTHVGSKAAAIL